MKKIISTICIILILLTNVVAIASEKFPDVNKNDWHYEYIKKLTELNGINGMSDGYFYPNKQISKAEFIKIVVATTIGVQPIDEINHWSTNYINKAIEKKILLENEFPIDNDEPINRQEMAKIMARTMEFILNEEIIIDTVSLTSKIKDWSETCEVCKPDIAQVFSKGIIIGMEDGTFKGTNLSTRAEASTMIVRLIDKSYRMDMSSDIIFNDKIHVNEDGNMKIDKAEEYLIKTLDTMEFYKEGNKYYVKGNIPELLEGFEIRLTFSTDYKREVEGCFYTTHPIFENDTRVIPKIGKFNEEITNMISIDDIHVLSTVIAVVKKDNPNSSNSNEGVLSLHMNDKNTSLSLIYKDSNNSKNINYDLEKLFNWK